MIRRVGNRAFRLLNSVLNLDGNEVVSEVETDQAVLTVPLDRMIATQLVEPVTWIKTITQGVANISYALNPRLESIWTEIIRGDENQGLSQDVPDDWELLFTHFGAASDDWNDVSDLYFFISELASPSPTQDQQLVTNSLSANTGQILRPAAGEPYYLIAMPFWYPPRVLLEVLVNTTAADTSLVLFAHGYAAPRGVMGRPAG